MGLGLTLPQARKGKPDKEYNPTVKKLKPPAYRSPFGASATRRFRTHQRIV